MTEEEFHKEMEEFWAWVSKRERPACSWFLALTDWASTKYEEAHRLQKETP